MEAAGQRRYDLRITPYADSTSAAVRAAPVTFADVAVSDGRFRVEFELPTATVADAWIEVGVRDAGSAAQFAAIEGRTKAVAAGPIGACWSTTGDSASNPATNFLGTTDAQPLVLRVQDQQVARYEPSAILSNGLPITANVIEGSVANGVTAGVRWCHHLGRRHNKRPPRSRRGRGGSEPGHGHLRDGGGWLRQPCRRWYGNRNRRAAATVGGGRDNVASGHRQHRCRWHRK
jgi:hypothetical protein